MTPNLFTAADRVLRDPASLLSDDPDQLAAWGPSLALLTAAGAAVFGFTVGSWHGGLQALYAAIKAPLLLIVPLAVCLPALRALYDPWGTRLSPTRLALAGLAGMARAGLMSAAAAPVLWLLLGLQPWYPTAVLIVALTFGFAGLPGLATIATTLAPRRGSWLAAYGAILLLGATTAQTAWMLRPFIGRPGDDGAFLRPMENDVLHGLLSSVVAPTETYEVVP
jgi:hypothetical protein